MLSLFVDPSNTVGHQTNVEQLPYSQVVHSSLVEVVAVIPNGNDNVVHCRSFLWIDILWRYFSIERDNDSMAFI